MKCPKCGSTEMWDNTEKVKGGWKGPLYKCKQRDCEGVVWPPRGEGAGKSYGGRKPAEPRYTWKDLQTYYKNSVVIAKAVLGKEIPEAEPADIIAGTATVFIAATRDGIKPEPTP